MRQNNYSKYLLGAFPFVLIVLTYLYFSEARLSSNPDDKLLPSVTNIWQAFVHLATEKNPRTGYRLLWNDTLASLQRIMSGVGLAALFGLLMGVCIGLFYRLKQTLFPFIVFTSNIPPMLLLPILLIIFGTGESSKITLIFLGTVFFITRNITATVLAIPRQQIIKALTLGATQYGMVFRIVLPQTIPHLIDTVRVSLAAAWLFLIAAEAISATEGIGYRTFLVRRYLAMDIIIAYTLWLTLIAFIIDYALKKVRDIFFPWHNAEASND